MRRKPIIFLFLLFIVTNSVFAQIQSGQMFLRFAGNATRRIGKKDDLSNVKALGQVAFGYYFSPKLAVGIEAGYGFNTIRDMNETGWFKYFSENDSLDLRTDFVPVTINLRYNLCREKFVIPYIMGGLGYDYWEIKDTKADSTLVSKRNFMSVIGLGFEFEFSRSFALDLGVRYHNLFDQDKDMAGAESYGYTSDISEGHFSIGLGFSFRFGGWFDSDNDKISDRQDKCPHQAEDFDGFEDDDGCPDIDNDQDGLRDEVETNTGVFRSKNDCGTDPNNPDSDNDGLNDYEEVYKYNTNPLLTNSDGDSISDLDEVHKYKTNPALTDTDKDELNDDVEIFTYFTDPNVPDTDGDGLVDGRDKCPLEPETYNGYKDDDGCPDEKPDTIFRKKTPVILEGVQFKTGSAILTEGSKVKVQSVLNTLLNYPEMHLEISGHTDNTGSRAVNIKLSKARAEAVRNYLISKGVEDYRLRAIGLGPDYPIASNKTAEGRAKNRRIEFYRTK